MAAKRAAEWVKTLEVERIDVDLRQLTDDVGIHLGTSPSYCLNQNRSDRNGCVQKICVRQGVRRTDRQGSGVRLAAAHSMRTMTRFP